MGFHEFQKHQESLQDYEIHIAGHHFQGVFLKLNEQQRGVVLQANGTLKIEVIESLTSPVAISHDDIILSIQEIFGEASFFLSDSESVNNEISLIQDRAWSLCYGAQSFYKPSGDSDFERYGSISEQQFLSLTDLEKIQLFQIRGIMGGAISAIKVSIANNPNMNEGEKVIHLNNLTKGKYVEFHREFSLQYFLSKKVELKKLALKKLKEIALNLIKLNAELKNRNEKLKLKNFTLKSLESQIEIKEKAIHRLKRQELLLVTLRSKKNFTQKDQQTLSRIKKSIKQKECQLKKLNDKLFQKKYYLYFPRWNVRKQPTCFIMSSLV